MKKIILGIIMAFGAIIFISQNTSAISVGTAGFDLNYRDYNGSWQWRGGLAYNTKTPIHEVRAYQFTTPNITPTGNFATVHFETTMVFQSNSWDRLNFNNLGSLSIGACNSSLGHSLTIKAQSISYAITPWVDGTVTKSLTIYGDISLSNIRKQQQQIVCAINTGSDNPFFNTYNVTGASQWFESNPMTWNFTDDQTEALLQEQIIQNQYMIQQNHTQIEATYENTRALYNQNQKIDNINDSITDSNVSGNFNLTAIQPFGPIATITNNVLSLPLILVGVGTCTDVVAPLPYINENLIIECPHKWLPQMAGQFYNMADGVFSAGLYFILARYIFKKVQNLRDPNNDDEEYLDI